MTIFGITIGWRHVRRTVSVLMLVAGVVLSLTGTGCATVFSIPGVWQGNVAQFLLYAGVAHSIGESAAAALHRPPPEDNR